MVSNEYRDFFTYDTTIYSGGEVFLHQLQYVVGDTTMQDACSTTTTRSGSSSTWTRTAFGAVAEATSHQTAGAVLAQRLHAVT